MKCCHMELTKYSIFEQNEQISLKMSEARAVKMLKNLHFWAKSHIFELTFFIFNVAKFTFFLEKLTFLLKIKPFSAIFSCFSAIFGQNEHFSGRSGHISGTYGPIVRPSVTSERDLWPNWQNPRVYKSNFISRFHAAGFFLIGA